MKYFTMKVTIFNYAFHTPPNICKHLQKKASIYGLTVLGFFYITRVSTTPRLCFSTTGMYF